MKDFSVRFIFLGLFFSSFFSAHAQNILDTWHGELAVSGVKLSIVFHISEENGVYTTLLDSPDQSAFGIQTASTTWDGHNLEIKAPAMGMTYKGELSKSDSLVGVFVQGSNSLPLNLGRGNASEVRRPQEPKGPFPYVQEECIIRNEKDHINLAGTLSLPKKRGKYPVVILISGSGPQNRDCEILGHKPFKVLADYFSRNGFAVLRMDDRGVGQSGGSFRGSTSYDFANDIEAAVEYLAQHKNIRRQEIGLIGHSEGGLIAPIVASRNPKVAFTILLAGPGTTGKTILHDQTILISQANGTPQSEIDLATRIGDGAMDLVLKHADTEILKQELRYYFSTVFDELKEGDYPDGMTKAEFVEASSSDYFDPWLQNFIRHDPRPYLEKLQTPVLAVFGEKDLQVPSEQNQAAMEKSLLKGGNPNFSVYSYANLNHLFQECTTGSPNEYKEIEQTFSTLVMEDLLDWMKEQTK